MAYKKIWAVLLAAAIGAGVFSACAPKDSAEKSGSSSGAASQTAPKEQEEIVFTPDDPAAFAIYKFQEYNIMRPDRKPVFVPLFRPQSEGFTARAFHALFDYESGFSEIPAFTVSVEGGTAAVTFDEVSVNFSEADLVSLWATIVENNADISKVCFMVGEIPYESQYLDAQGYFVPMEITLPSCSMEELEAIRKAIPYQEPENGDDYIIAQPILKNDPVAEELSVYLQRILLANGLPLEPFDKIEDADSGFIIRAAVNDAVLYHTDDPSDPNYREELIPLEETSSDIYFYLKEHVAQSAKKLFGEDVPVEHGSEGIYHYNEYAGVYIPIRMGIHAASMPVILSCQNLGDKYEAELVMIAQQGEGAFMDNGAAIALDELEAYCQAKKTRYKVTFRKVDGMLHLSGCSYIGAPYQLNWPSYFLDFTNEQLVAVADAGGRHETPMNLENMDNLQSFTHYPGGHYLWIIPQYAGSVLRIEEIGSGTPAVIYEYQLGEYTDDYALRLETTDLGNDPQIQIVVEYGGQTVVYPMKASSPEQQAPETVLLLDEDVFYEGI